MLLSVPMRSSLCRGTTVPMVSFLVCFFSITWLLFCLAMKKSKCLQSIFMHVSPEMILCFGNLVYLKRCEDCSRAVFSWEFF